MGLGPGYLWWLSCRAYRLHLTPIARLLKLANYVLYRAILPYQAEIERDILLDHLALGVVAHPNVTIGRRVRIYHRVTLAAETWIGSEHRIIIEDDAVIGVGAVIIGRGDRTLRIGRGAQIGANAVVTGDVPDGVVVVGVPARPVERRRESEAAGPEGRGDHASTNGAYAEAGRHPKSAI